MDKFSKKKHTVSFRYGDVLKILTNTDQFREKRDEEMDNSLEVVSKMALAGMSFNHHCSISRS